MAIERRVKARLGAALVTIIASVAFIPAMAHAATVSDPAAASDGSPTCSSTRVSGQYVIGFNYNDGTPSRVCLYPGQYAWMAAARDAVVREENGSSHYSYLMIDDSYPTATAMALRVEFHGPGGEVDSSPVAGGPGASSGWSDYYEVPCKVSSRGAHHVGETAAWSYFVHEVGEAYRQNIAFTEITSPANNAVAYAPHCQSPLS